jgi:hypothetical protein
MEAIVRLCESVRRPTGINWYHPNEMYVQSAEDRDRFAKTLGSVTERRLTYDELTGKIP